MNEKHNIESLDDHEFGKRLGIVVAVFAIFVIAIVVMLLNIQVINVKKYKQKAVRQYERVITESAQRGVILDRNSRMLAESIESVSFYANPAIVRHTPLFNEKGKSVIDKVTRKQKVYDNSIAVANLFARHLGGSKGLYLKELRRRTGMAVLGRKIPMAKALRLMHENIPGVWFDKENQRYYLNVAAQVIGSTDIKNNGISGLELQLNKELKGVDGTRIYQRSATGNRYPSPDAKQQDPVKGNSVQLTIDADIQSIVEDELLHAVNKFHADAASSIVMEVRTGEIIAMANNPSFDLNQRSTWSPEKSRNRAVTDSYEPGSTFKLVMASAATEVLKRKAEDRVSGMSGIMPIYNLFIRDHEPLGNITFREAIMKSSNIVAAKTALAVGSEKFYAYTLNLGFGRKTGIGLVGESPGRVRPLARWDRTTLPWMGYGYQVMATPLQILQAYATIANDGKLMRPYIIRKVVNAEGKIVWESAPKIVRTAVLPQTARYLGKEYFKAVVDSGTAKSAAVPGVTVAGKTGTARRAAGGSYSKPVYVSSFVGYFPVENPRYAIIVVVENPKTAYYAATVAAPVFSGIASRMMACSEEMQKKLSFCSPEQALLDSVSTVTVPQLMGLQGRDAERLLKWYNLEVQFSGDLDGFVVSQSIAPGQRVEKKRMIRVTLAGRNMNKKSS
ncbi:MAG: transpeptidase family protein [Chlorobiaceae bacterium]|nr:transpeptidase family protein [Chlorobiaceae bacterium]